MKTPRQLLLARHAATERKLDALRRRVIGEIGESTPAELPASAAIRSIFCHEDAGPPVLLILRGFRQWLRPLRFHLAGLAAVWVAIIAIKLATPADGEASVAKASSLSPEQLIAVAEKRKFMAELIDLSPSPASEASKNFLPRPRGELRLNSAAA